MGEYVKIVEYFRVALQHLILEEFVSAGELGVVADTSPGNITKFLNGIKGLGLAKQERIAIYFNLTHLDMIILGKDLCEECLYE